MTLMTKPTYQSQKIAAHIVRPSREKSEDRAAHLLWLDKNENCDADYIAFIHELNQSLPVASLFGYPDCHQFYQKLALHLNKEIKQLFLAAGSDGIIRAVFDAFVLGGDTVIYTEPTFAMYPLYAKMANANAHILHYQPTSNGPSLLADTVLEAIRVHHPRLVCLPNPNSPTGTVFAAHELRQIIEVSHEHAAIVLIDEAYYPFYAHTVSAWINQYPNLIVARTFSKAWGLAGIRLGYGMGHGELINQLHQFRPMYEAGALSLAIAQRMLKHEDQMLAAVQRLNQGKKYFISCMQQLGFKTLPTEGNFLHVAFADYAGKIHHALAKQVLYRQDFPHPSLAGYSRFTATTSATFSPVVQTINQVLEKGSHHVSN